MQRCIQLAESAAGYVAPNPMVGAVLVHENRIIGEGYHQQYGGPHAEVHCINSVKEADRHLIPQSTIYVSLEPCAHFGKTPPCADLIIEKKIPHVVIGCRDPFKQVDGKGVEKLQAAGIQVTMNVLEQECKTLNKRFITFHTEHRPYIVLKWAQTANAKIAGEAGGERLLISNEFTNRLVHKWRGEEAAILVGTNTALFDDPSLTTRLWKGANPMRLVVDMNLRLPSSLQLFNKQVKTIVFNGLKHDEQENLLHYQVTQDVKLVHQIANALYQLKVQSVLVEGGAQLLQSFIDEGLWDETRVITNNEQIVANGLPAPRMQSGRLLKQESLFSDTLQYFVNPQTLVQ
ncbi:diaminohydroxyphosphoribosylaminopyrimidine deaminase/5-amino-6-(5-phosphoribosylamino)uracil reductase [Chitinophagaceae bacterium OAS944]|nr:diaminohydroxyphosphoribosylaminopyrimidine deaminase/5-amino-6-(5-phosphoribosylamino)uracil reductase [Chitinophagaceae bacterium OAS944]